MGVVQRIREAVTHVAKGSEAIYISGPGADVDEHLWSPLGNIGGLTRDRNLPPITQQQMITQAHHMYKGNPLAKRIIDIQAEYVVGDGILYVAQNPEVKDILDNHWTDTTNNWGIDQFEATRDLGLVGELCLTTHINKANGTVTLGNIDPELIERVIFDPDNNRKIYAVILKKIRTESHRRAYKVVDTARVSQGERAWGRLVGLPETDEEMDEFGYPFKLDDEVEVRLTKGSSSTRPVQAKWAGSCFFFTINKPRTASRGWSDLLCDLDWIDAHDQFLFSQVEKAVESAKYVWDIELRGMNEKQQRDWLRKQPAYKPGTRFTHNENITQQVMTTDLHLEDAASLANTLKNHILAGAGMPPIWFAESLVSRASAPEMTEPVFKHLRMRQRYVAYMITQVFRFTIDQAIISGYFQPDRRVGQEEEMRRESGAFYLRLPDVSAKDQRMLSIAIKNTTAAIDTAIEREFISKEEGKRLFKQYMDLTGMDSHKQQPSRSTLAGEVDSNFDPNLIFKRVEESGEREITTGDGTYFISMDRVSKFKRLVESNGRGSVESIESVPSGG